MKNRLFLVGILTACLYVSCIGNKVSFTPQQKTNVLAEVQLMAETIAKNVSAEGPTAWLNGFENTPDFFMASDGQLAFPNYDSATDFINNNLTKRSVRSNCSGAICELTRSRMSLQHSVQFFMKILPIVQGKSCRRMDILRQLHTKLFKAGNYEMPIGRVFRHTSNFMMFAFGSNRAVKNIDNRRKSIWQR